MILSPTNHRDRVNEAINHQKTDSTPCDFAAVPEIWQALSKHFNKSDRRDILKELNVDCRVATYDSFCHHPQDENNINLSASAERSSVGGLWRKVLSDQSNIDIWGAHRRPVANRTGSYDEFASHPLAGISSLEEVASYSFPKPDWWNFSGLHKSLDTLCEGGQYNVRWRVGSVFETAWSLVGFEEFQILMLTDPTIPMAIMETICDLHINNLKHVLEIAGERIDIVYIYDDVAIQNNLLISPETYANLVKPHHQRLFDLAHQYNKKMMMHSCGAIRPLLPTLIDMGLDILNPVQTSARGMNPVELKNEFGNDLCFHGAIDVQQFLPHATPQEIREEVKRMEDLFSADGGWIMSGSHHIQSDTPIENVLAMYNV